MATWHTKETLRAIWRDAPDTDELLDELLEVAKDQVIEFAPVLADGEAIPTRYRYGQYMQAKALWEGNQSSMASTDMAIGQDGFSIRLYDMSASIKRVLRPPNPVPKVG